MLTINVKSYDREDIIYRLEGLLGSLDWDSSSVSTETLRKLLVAVARSEKRRINWILEHND